MALVAGIVAVAALGMGLAPAPANAQEEAALRAAEQLGASLYQVDRALRAAEKEGDHQDNRGMRA